ncbi:unnamed protein product, partial [Mesorhabditis belari]|uniref:Uncharacterized protein n=1 Tax=Mesorhabditis belari TaxID=2138241 RepID=A0AAF3EBG0_9BILA
MVNVLSLQLTRTLQPFRLGFFLIALLAFVFALLVVVENVALFIGTTVGSTSLSILLLPYFLSWLLLFFAVFFGRIAYELHTNRFQKTEPRLQTAWTPDSRPCTPSVYDIETHSQCSQDTLLQGDLLQASIFLGNPHYIPEEISREIDQPPAYDEVVIRANHGHLLASRSPSTPRAVSAPSAILSVCPQRILNSSRSPISGDSQSTTPIG